MVDVASQATAVGSLFVELVQMLGSAQRNRDMTPVQTTRELLLDLVQPATNDEATARLNSLLEQINSLLEQDLAWDWLLNTAHEHRVLPLVYQRLAHFP